jgi:hypothetical protein
MACAGRLALEAAYPNLSNEHSDRGTACHFVAAQVLTSSTGQLEAADYLDDPVLVSDPDEPKRYVTFDSDLVEMTQGYCDEITELRKHAVETMIETRVEFSDYIGVPDQFGTADVIMLRPMELVGVEPEFELQVCDLKTGYHYVDAEENSQCMLYALGALRLFDLAYNIKQVRCMIYQPRHGGMREWTCSVEHLLAFAKTAKAAAQRVEEATASYDEDRASGDGQLWEATYLHPNPNEVDCAHCRARPTCPAAKRKLESMMECTFDEVIEGKLDREGALENRSPESISKAMQAVGFMEDFCKDVRAECERRLLLSMPVEGFGLELGRQGARAWKDKEAAETYLRKSLRLPLEKVFDMSLKSPTSIEAMAGFKNGKASPKLKALAVVSEKQWKKMQANIQRSDPKPSVKPLSIITKLYKPTEPDAGVFDNVEEEL